MLVLTCLYLFSEIFWWLANSGNVIKRSARQPGLMPKATDVAFWMKAKLLCLVGKGKFAQFDSLCSLHARWDSVTSPDPWKIFSSHLIHRKCIYITRTTNWIFKWTLYLFSTLLHLFEVYSGMFERWLKKTARELHWNMHQLSHDCNYGN